MAEGRILVPWEQRARPNLTSGSDVVQAELSGMYSPDWRGEGNVWEAYCRTCDPVFFPVFSPAQAPGYSDIRIPSHYYYGQTRRYTYGYDPVNMELKEVDGIETPWDMKSDKIFWRGASTGGGSSPPGFAAQYQRHRFFGSWSQTAR